MEYSPDNVEKAVIQFYQDASNQQEINSWLMKAQVSPQAWHFSWVLLSKEKATEVKFFGALVLHVKISRFWRELSEDKIEPLRRQLLSNIILHADGPKVVLTRLCVTLAACLLQATPEHWPNAVINVIETFQCQNFTHMQSVDVCLILLEILTVIPEEFISSHLVSARKGTLRSELRKGLPQVLSLIESLLSSENSTPQAVIQQSLKCLCSWAQFGIALPDIEAIIPKVFGSLHNEIYFDTAIETLIQVFIQPDTYKFPNSVEKILPYVFGLQPMLQRSIEQQDSETIHGLTKFIIAFAEQDVHFIFQLIEGTPEQKQIGLTLVNMVLMCTNAPGYFPVDECSSDITFGFWYNLQDGIVALDEPRYAVLAPIFTTVYSTLVQILLKKVQFPADEEYASWRSDEKESYRCYRQDIADTFMYAYGFLHDPLLGSFCHTLSIILNRTSTENVKWQEIEAILYAISSIAENVDVEECLYLPQLFNTLGRIPFNNHTLISTALCLVGAYAEWLSGHHEMLPHVLPLILGGVVDSSLAQPATLALKEVVRENQAHINPYLPAILSKSKQALDAGEIMPRDAERLMCCVGYALSVLPVPEILQYMDVLLAPHFTQLQNIAAQSQMTADHKTTVQLIFDMMSSLFSSLDTNWDVENHNSKESSASTQTPPVRIILEKLLPILQQILSKFLMDAEIVESACGMLKSVIRTLLVDIAPLYQHLAELCVHMYNSAPQPPILDISKQLLILFANDDAFKKVSESLFASICYKTLSLFESTVIMEQPDLQEAFMSFLSQISKKNKQLLCGEVSHWELLKVGVIGLSMEDAPIVKCSSQFLVEFILLSLKETEIDLLLKREGHVIMETIIRAVAGESPRTVIDILADVLLALNKHQSPMLNQALKDITAKDQWPNPKCTRAQKEEFAKQILKEKSNKRVLKSLLQEYTLIWRGLFGTEYAAQTQNLFAS